ncbi:MAG: hypothetical protein FJZ01_27955 [Candidatus Sericytochromatia bacterium]|nr:hypothetical protein [Candidatus Tanganyikabacteria bacterium]
MPRYSVIAVRLALIHLMVGSALGALLLAAKGVPALALPPALAAAIVASHAPQLLFGWTALLAFGVAFWILPRFMQGPPRGREWPAWVALVALNAGVLASFAGWFHLAHGLLALGCAAFALHAVPRVRTLAREC